MHHTLKSVWARAPKISDIRPLVFALLFAVMSIAAPAPAAADDLDDARAAGYLGERPDGLLGQVKAAPPPVVALMNDINARRSAQYAQIAKKNNTSVEAVQAIVAKKIQEKIQPGWYFMDAGGNWQQK